MNTKKFLDQNVVSNRWVKDHNLEIYLRKGPRYISYNERFQKVQHDRTMRKVFALDIANITANTPGRGNFTSYLKYLENLLKNKRFVAVTGSTAKKEIECIYIENIHNARFVKFLSKHGFKTYYPFQTTWPCAVKFINEIHSITKIDI